MIAAGFLPINDPGQPWVAILYASAILIALGVILKAPGLVWRRIVKPAATAVVEMDTISQLARVAPDLILLSKMGPVISEMAEQFKSNPEKNGDGSSLRDSINRLEQTSLENAQALEVNAKAVDEAAKVARGANAMAAKAATAAAGAASAAAVAASAAVSAAAAAVSAVETAARLSTSDRTILQNVLEVAKASDATITRIEETNPVTPAPRPQAAA